jgi:hypothetical protein
MKILRIFSMNVHACRQTGAAHWSRSLSVKSRYKIDASHLAKDVFNNVPSSRPDAVVGTTAGPFREKNELPARPSAIKKTGGTSMSSWPRHPSICQISYVDLEPWKYHLFRCSRVSPLGKDSAGLMSLAQV